MGIDMIGETPRNTQQTMKTNKQGTKQFRSIEKEEDIMGKVVSQCIA